MAKTLRRKSLENAILTAKNANERKGLEGEYIVLEAIELHLPDSTTIIWNPNLLSYEADLLIYDPAFGFVFVEVKNWELDFAFKFHLNGSVETKSRLENPLKQTENYRSELKSYVESTISEKLDIHRLITSMVVFSGFKKSDFLQREEVKNWTGQNKEMFFKKHFFIDDLTGPNLLGQIMNTRKFYADIDKTLSSVDINKIIESLGQESETPPTNSSNGVKALQRQIKREFVEESSRNNLKPYWSGVFIILIVFSLIAFNQDAFITHEDTDYIDEYSTEDNEEESNSEDNKADFDNDVSNSMDTGNNDDEIFYNDPADENIENPEEDILDKVLEKSNVKELNASNHTTESSSLDSLIGKEIDEGFITLGSTKDDVINVLGNPSTVYGSINKWSYGRSSIDFNNDNQVVGWDDFDNELNVDIGKTKNTFFSLGSTKNEVIDAMGTPSTIYNSINKWSYGRSSIDFNNDNQVVGWDDFDNELKVDIGKTKNTYFSLGSTKKEVIDAMGTPTRIYNSINKWSYGNSTIDFKGDDQVVGWDNNDNLLEVESEE